MIETSGVRYVLQYRSDEDPDSSDADGPWYTQREYAERDRVWALQDLQKEQAGSSGCIHVRLMQQEVTLGPLVPVEL